MTAGSAFQARGPATDSARSPILVRVRGISKVRLSAERRCDRPDVADVSVARLLMKSGAYIVECCPSCEYTSQTVLIDFSEGLWVYQLTQVILIVSSKPVMDKSFQKYVAGCRCIVIIIII